jgi:hypothetical protein
MKWKPLRRPAVGPGDCYVPWPLKATHFFRLVGMTTYEIFRVEWQNLCNEGI